MATDKKTTVIVDARKDKPEAPIADRARGRNPRDVMFTGCRRRGGTGRGAGGRGRGCV